MNYYISDLHFGHKNEAVRRGFSSAEEMDELIISNWNNKVTPDDHVYIVGDFEMKSNKDVIVNYVKRLNGHLHLIEGNHDDQNLKNPAFRKCFETVNVMRQVKDNGKRVILFHFPMAEWPGYYHGYIHIFGHIHANKKEAYHIMKKLKNAYNVGADCIGYTPRTLKELEEGDCYGDI